MTGAPTVTRAPAWIEREYGREKWPAVERLIEEHADGEPSSLSRVLQGVARSQWYGPDALELSEQVLGGRRVTVPRSVGYGALRGLIDEVVLSVCSPRTDLVVELASGWAWHLLSIWLAGGPRTATYVGAEYTAAGRRAASRLASLDPQLRFRSLPFDLGSPRLEVARGSEAVVFTHHGIEQVPRLSPRVFEAIRGVAERVTCVHFEPIGWQLGNAGEHASEREYAERNDYNRDLVDRLRDEEAAGRIEIAAVAPNVVGVNPAHSISVTVWRSVLEEGDDRR